MIESAPPDLVRRLRDAHRSLIISHSNPDGDSIGTGLGLARVLRQLGKSATVWNLDPTPSVYAHLPGASRIHQGDEPPPDYPDAYDTLVFLECPTPDRSGLERHFQNPPLAVPKSVNIDHHLGNSFYGAVNWVDSAAPAVGQMVLELAEELGVNVDADTATCLYVALITDTGGLRYSNASDRAFHGAGRLVAAGASPETVSKWLYESRTPGSVRLLGTVLRTLELHQDGRIATVLLSRDMFEEADASQQDSEGLVDVPRSIEGVDAVALLRELEDGGIKVSLRSRGETSVVDVATRHGGGGHRNAAGCVLSGELEEARAAIVEDLLGVLEPAAS